MEKPALNVQESVNKPATIPQKSSSSHVPTFAMSPLSLSESSIYSFLQIPTNFSKRSFSFSAPTICNELPAAIRESNTLDTFKCRLKTHLTSVTNHPQRITTSARPATARASDSTCSSAARVTSFRHSFIHSFKNEITEVYSEREWRYLFRKCSCKKIKLRAFEY